MNRATLDVLIAGLEEYAAQGIYDPWLLSDGTVVQPLDVLKELRAAYDAIGEHWIAEDDWCAKHEGLIARAMRNHAGTSLVVPTPALESKPPGHPERGSSSAEQVRPAAETKTDRGTEPT